MKDLNWEQGLVRVYYVLWTMLAGFTLIVSIVWTIDGGGFKYMVLWAGLAVIAPAIALKVLRWGIPWLINGFVK